MLVFSRNLHFSRLCRDKRKEPCVPRLLETEVRDGFMQTGTSKMLCCKHGGSRVKLSLWPFYGGIPGPSDTIWASFENKNKTQTAVTNICLNYITFINLTFRMLQHTSSEVIIIPTYPLPLK